MFSIGKGAVFFILVVSMVLPFSMPSTSYGQSTSNGQDPFLGDWTNDDRTNSITKATIKTGTASNLPYHIDIQNCELYPCSWDGEKLSETNYIEADQPRCDSIVGYFILRVYPSGAQIEVTIDQYELLGTNCGVTAIPLPIQNTTIQPVPQAPSPIGVVVQSVLEPFQSSGPYPGALQKSYKAVLSRAGTGTGSCSSLDNKISVALSTNKLTMTPTSNTQVNIYLNASSSNFGDLDMVVGPHILSADKSASSQSGIDASVDKSSFFVAPGQLMVVPLNIKSSSAVVGDYILELEISALDAYRCQLPVQPLDLSLQIRPPPDFTISANNQTHKVLRGDSLSEIPITIRAFNGTVAPLKMSYTLQVGESIGIPPSNATVSLFASNGIIYPGQSQNASLRIAAPFIDDPNLAGPNYTGNFTYTIIATGEWNETATIQRTIIKKLEIPFSVTEEPFDFRITSNKQILYLLPHERASMRIDIEHIKGRHFPVSLKLEGLMLGLTLQVDKKEGLGNFTSILNIDPVNFSFGSRDFQIRAEGGGITHILPFTVSQAPFKVVIDPAGTSAIAPGQSSMLTVSVIPNTKDYKSKVTLNVKGEPENSPVTLKLSSNQGIPPFSTKLNISSSLNSVLPNNSKIILSASDGQFVDIANHTLLANPQIQVDLEPRFDSLNLDNVSLSKDQLPLIVSAGSDAGSHRIFAKPEIILDSGSKYVFKGWSDGVKSNDRVISSTQISALTIVGIYRPQYYLNITSPYGGVKGSGWYDNATQATIEIQREISTDSGVQEFSNWNGTSIDSLDKSCDGQAIGEKTTSNLATFDSYSICMNRPQALIATWKTAETSGKIASIQSNGPIFWLLGGTIAAAGGILGYFKFIRPTVQKIPGTKALLEQQSIADSNQSSNNNNQQKGQQRNFPILQWHIYAPRVIRAQGKTFVDVIIENVGQTDVKKVKIDITCPRGLQYDGGAVMIELILANESRKTSFSLRHVDNQQGPFDVTLSLGYEFMTKFVKRNEEKKITLNVQQLRAGLFEFIEESESEIRSLSIVKSWLEERRFLVHNFNMAALSSQSDIAPLDADILIISIEALSKSTALVEFLEEQAKYGINVFVYSAGNNHSNSNEGYRKAAAFVGFSPLDSHQTKVQDGFGLKVLNAESPITRNYYGSDIFRIADQSGIVLAGSVAAGSTALLEQFILIEGSGDNGLRTIPAIQLRTTEAGSSIIFFNFPIEKNILVVSQLLDRTLLFAAKMLG